MEMFRLPSNGTAKERALWDFNAVLLLLYCLLHLMQKLLSCSAWLFLLADAEQAAKLFQYQAITKYKSSVCSFIYNMQPHQLPHAQSDNPGTAQAGQDRTACSSERQKPTPLQTFPSVPFWQCLHLPPFHLYPPLHSLSFPSTPSSTTQGKGAWAVAGWATASPPPPSPALRIAPRPEGCSVWCPRPQLIPSSWRQGRPAWGWCGGCGAATEKGTGPQAAPWHTACSGMGLLTGRNRLN